jgi:arylsulfatase A-like enzyme
MAPRELEHVIALYDGEIAFTDSYIGKLLDLLRGHGIYDDTLIVLTADHGDEFLEHRLTGHNKSLYQESIADPLIIKFPGRRWSGTRSSLPVSIVDIAPTLLDYVGQSAHGDFDGQSLLPLMGEDPIQEERTLFADLCNDLKVARSGRHKFIRRWDHPKGGAGKLLDLAEDPAEKSNRVWIDPQRAEAMKAIIADWREAAARLDCPHGGCPISYRAPTPRSPQPSWSPR